MLAEPNSRFIEILPEMSLNIGLGLKVPIITRAAFAVLVSEEALSIVSRRASKFDADKAGTNQFLRVREDIDEDSLNSVQHAAHDFQDRISGVFDALVHEEMPWFDQLPEFMKIRHFEAFITSTERCSVFGFTTDKGKANIKNLIVALRHFVRGRILWCFTLRLPPIENTLANNHRRAEQYLKDWDPRDFSLIYTTLTSEEKLMTRFFWKILKHLEWDNWYGSNLLPCDPTSGAIHELNMKTGGKYKIGLVTILDLEAAKNVLNSAVTKAIQDGADLSSFSLVDFFKQVDMYINNLCNTVLDSGEVDFAALTDTLLCLSEEEWKYLPLWAGGNEDGSGGVYDATIPPAPAGAGPSGPGPSFHTGYSVNSRASTEVDFDGCSSVFVTGSVNTSLAVENGYIDHLDRRIVRSEDGFNSEEQDYMGKDKEKAFDHSTPLGSESSFDTLGDVKMGYAKSEGDTEHDVENQVKPICDSKDSTIHVSTLAEENAVSVSLEDTTSEMSLTEEDECWSFSEEEDAFDLGEEEDGDEGGGEETVKMEVL